MGGNLSEEIFEKMCRQYLLYLKFRKIKKAEFCFSGGEPLIAQTNFYAALLKIQEKVFNISNIEIINLIQTNGLLLNEEWIDFIGKRRFKLGISCDGTAQSVSRPAMGEENSLKVLEKNLDLLNKKGLEFGFLCVVSGFNKSRAGEIMRWMISKNPKSIAFIPCLDYAGKIGAADYGKFLSEAFDSWLDLKRYEVRVRNFHFAMLYFLGAKNPDLPCENAGACPCTVNVNLNGDVYVCDVFMGKETGRLGNLTESGFIELEKAEKWRKIREFSSSLPSDCVECEYLPICNGGCLYRRLNRKRLDYLCDSHKKLFGRIKDFISSSLLPGDFKKTASSFYSYR